ncbi:hypothetical protein [Streptomyces sp. AC1-42T]|uniref:hypothetical protein n=1 Tax=Streptomyces sp. AC1-42T TaxID=2218665 RepID=UPI000DAC8D3F|nr:hypothetical protein [Streptomyces sp. AC1-42T]PZT71539.1 hypothetical protein DNK55_33045 [Streptomyces sp. AC1-42T]
MTQQQPPVSDDLSETLFKDWPSLDAAAFPPGHPDAPPAPVPPPPPGMVWALAPNGQRVLAYLPQPDTHATPEPSEPARKDPWPMRMLAGGGSSAAVLGVVGHYGPGLNAAGHAAQMAGIGVAATAAGVGALVLIVKGGLARQSGTNVSVNVNVTNSSSSTSTSRSRGGRR